MFSFYFYFFYFYFFYFYFFFFLFFFFKFISFFLFFSILLMIKSRYVLVDTPGQIEVFNWSASGTIITESLASVSPTVMLYIVDTPRSASPSTFMSNMLYACSILYKSKLPLIVVFNKVDVVRHDFAVEWSFFLLLCPSFFPLFTYFFFFF